MSGKIFLGLLLREGNKHSYGFNLRGQLNCRFFSTNRKVKQVKNMRKLLSFEDFKNKHIEQLESFKQSHAVKVVCGDDLEKISDAYERFCLSEYSSYMHQAYGGNPSFIT